MLAPFLERLRKRVAQYDELTAVSLARDFRPLGPLPKRVAFTDQEEAMTDFVESGICLSLARDPVIERITRERNFVIADKVALTCDLSFACLTSRRQEPTIAHAFIAMQAVWDLKPDKAPLRSAQ